MKGIKNFHETKKRISKPLNFNCTCSSLVLSRKKKHMLLCVGRNDLLELKKMYQKRKEEFE